MEQIDPTFIANTILTAPDRVKLDLAAPADRVRQAAAAELAKAIVEQASRANDEPDPRQLGLAL